MSFVPMSELLKIDVDKMYSKASNDIKKFSMLKNIYKKTKDPEIKDLVKIYEKEVKKDIKKFEHSKKISKETSKELIEMKKRNRKFLD